MSMLSSVGAFILAFGFLVFFANGVRSLRRGAIAGSNPWGGHSLEWAYSSPAPRTAERESYVVESGYPLWIGKLGRVTGLERDENLVTRIVDAEPDHKVKVPGRTAMPLLAALASGAMIIACIYTPWGLVYGIPPIAIALTLWYWPHGDKPSELYSKPGLHVSEEVPR
jgi:cytochrome c oxidase subunit 1